MLEIINENMVFLKQDFSTQNDVFECLSQKALELGLVKNTYYKAIIDRESKYPTGLQLEKYGVAIPHADSEHIVEEFIAVVTLKKPVEFKSMEDPNKVVSVDIVFALGLKNPDDQLTTLQTVIGIFQDEDKLNGILNANTYKELIDVLS